MTNEPFVIERLLDAPSAKVWRAITDKDQMKEWYFDLEEFKPEVGFEFRFTGKGKDGNKEFVHICVVTEVIPLQKLTYSWKYEGFAGISYVTMELKEEDGKTKFLLTHAGLESFPSDTSDFAKENFAEGWTYIVGTSLADYVKK